MHKSIEAIKTAFEARNLKFQVAGDENMQRIILNMTGDAATYTFHFVSTSSASNNVALRVFNLVTVPEHRQIPVLRLIYKIHSIMPTFKFTLDDDNTITVASDFPSCFESIGVGAVELLSGAVEFLDAVYPKIAQAAADQ